MWQIDQIAAASARLDSDVVVLTGDWNVDSGSDQYSYLSAAMSRIKAGWRVEDSVLRCAGEGTMRNVVRRGCAGVRVPACLRRCAYTSVGVGVSCGVGCCAGYPQASAVLAPGAGKARPFPRAHGRQVRACRVGTRQCWHACSGWCSPTRDLPGAVVLTHSSEAVLDHTFVCSAPPAPPAASPARLACAHVTDVAVVDARSPVSGEPASDHRGVSTCLSISYAGTGAQQ